MCNTIKNVCVCTDISCFQFFFSKIARFLLFKIENINIRKHSRNQMILKIHKDSKMNTFHKYFLSYKLQMS